MRGTARVAAQRITPIGRHPVELRSSYQGRFAEFITRNRQTQPLSVIQPGQFAGARVAICGAGPSLKDNPIRGASHIFACNGALPYLVGQGVKVDAAVGIDQSPALIAEWQNPPDVPYLLASTVDPDLVAHLQSHGRSVTFFHNYCGTPGEEALYKLWPSTFMLGAGWTVVSRFMWAAFYMGVERVDLYGADCAFTPDGTAYANGQSREQAWPGAPIYEGEIDGRLWRTRPDMLMAAVDLVRSVRKANGRIRLVGDTLPVWLLGKDDAMLDQVCRQLGADELPPS